ncbi:MAG: glycosyltransferase, partial [Candidatus Azambacteria bacterium]|nr:glycosyltransferase [Candidatus Azambacteria bacterium]
AGVDGGGQFLQALQSANIPHKKLRHLRRAISPLDDLMCFFDIIQIMRNFSPDIVFLNSSKAGVLGTLAAMACRWLGKKFTLIYRIDWAFNDPRSTLERKAYVIVEKFLSKFRDIIMQNDNFDLSTAKSFGIKPRLGFKIIHNGIDINVLNFLSRQAARGFFRNKLKINLDKFELVVGNTANYYKTKDLPSLVRAVAVLAKSVNVGCVLVGDGTERKVLEKMIQEKGLQDRVFLTGQILDAYKYLRAYDVFTFSSVKEGFPWAILEAMAAELPIVATKVGAIPDIIQNGVSGRLVEPSDSAQMSEQILWLYKNRDAAIKFGLCARQLVKERFTLDALLAKYRQLFQNIIDNKASKISFD